MLKTPYRTIYRQIVPLPIPELEAVSKEDSLLEQGKLYVSVMAPFSMLVALIVLVTQGILAALFLALCFLPLILTPFLVGLFFERQRAVRRFSRKMQQLMERT